MASPPMVWPLDGAQVAVLADCHIHPGGGPAFPAELFAAIDGCDLIVTLGDMGESAGLDQLAALAPVIGVRGQDDSDDPRTDCEALVLEADGFTIGCVFDARPNGLALGLDPFQPAADFAAAAERLFGRRIDMLLHASTHRPAVDGVGAIAVINPGSAVLPAEGAARAFAAITGEGGEWSGHIVVLD